MSNFSSNFSSRYCFRVFSPSPENESMTWQHEPRFSPSEFYALMLGISLFTTFRSDANACWQRTHLKRLHSQADALQWRLPDFRNFADDVTHQLESVLKAREDTPAHRIRTTLFPYAFRLNQAAHQTPLPIACLLSVETPAPEISESLPPSIWNGIIKHYEHPLPTLKHGSQLSSLILHQKRQDAQDHILWQDSEGYITESTFANLFYHHPELGWCVPPKAKGLGGITRQQVLKAFQQCKVPLQERAWHIEDEVDAVFLTNSIQGWQRLSSVEYNQSPHREFSFKKEDEALSLIYKAWYLIAFGDRKSCYH